MDDARLGNGMTLEDIARELSAMRSDMSAMRSDLTGRITALDSKVDSLDSRTRIGFEETHRLIKLGFESVQILDEKVDRRFDETERQHADHRTVLEAAVRSLGRDVRPRQDPRGVAIDDPGASRSGSKLKRRVP